MTKIVSIHSFRGGTGKSNVTANVAALVAMSGKKVGIVNTDIQSPGIHVLFGLDSDNMGRTLNEYLRGECEIEDVAVRVDTYAKDTIGRKKLAGKELYLVPSSIDGMEISRILRDGYDINRLNEGIQTLRKKLDLDYLFIDTHPGLNEETLLSIAFSDILLIIMRPDQQDFQGTSVTVDVAYSLDVPYLYLVVNKALTKYDFKQMQLEIQEAFEAPVAGVLPLSEDMVDLASGDLFALRFPNHPFSLTMQGVAQVVVNSD